MVEVGRLQEYVESSQCVLLFYSSGYFFSRPCQREITFALDAKKPLVVVHEVDLWHGGQSLEELRRAAAAVFDTTILFEREIYTWHRVHDFQLLTLKKIAQVNASEHSGPERPRTLQNAPERSRTPQNAPERSRTLQKCSSPSLTRPDQTRPTLPVC